MKLVLTITALLLFVESINLVQLVDKAKVQGIHLLCDHEDDEENTCGNKTDVKEIDKNCHHYIFFTPAFIFFQKTTAYRTHAAAYISGFLSALHQPPKQQVNCLVIQLK